MNASQSLNGLIRRGRVDRRTISRPVQKVHYPGSVLFTGGTGRRTPCLKEAARGHGGLVSGTAYGGGFTRCKINGHHPLREGGSYRSWGKKKARPEGSPSGGRSRSKRVAWGLLLWFARGFMKPTILIADRNPYVRKFLQRELINAGYEVLPAENARQVVLLVDRAPSLVLIIVDPDLPDKDMTSIFEELHSRVPSLPVLVHSHAAEDKERYSGYGIWFVEKRGSSIEVIIRTVREILSGR